MAATLLLLLLFTSACLFSLYKFTPLSDHLPSPTSHQSFRDFIETLTIFKSNHVQPKVPNTYISLPDDNQLWPVIDDNDVVVLTDKNFSQFVHKNRHVMVMFCFHPMIPHRGTEFVAAAKLMKGEVVFAMVDGFVEIELRNKYRIPNYPTIHFFVDGMKKYEYDIGNVQEREFIKMWVKRKMVVGIHNITTMAEALDVRTSESMFVFGFLDSLEDSDSEELAAASKMHSDINFYQTDSAKVAELLYINSQIKPALIFSLPGLHYRFDGQFTRWAIADYISERKDPPVITFTYGHARRIFENPLKQLWLFSPRNCSELLCTFEAVATALRGKLLFVHVHLDLRSYMYRIASEFGITEDAPRIVAYNSQDGKKHTFDGELTLNNIKCFAEYFLQNEPLSQSDQASETVLKLGSQYHASLINSNNTSEFS